MPSTHRAMPHLLNLTRENEPGPGEAYDPDADGYRAEIICVAVAPYCTLWLPCPQCDGVSGHYADWLREEVSENEAVHGQDHQIIDGTIMRPTDRCYLSCEPDWTTDSISDLIRRKRLAIPGLYVIDHSYDGDQYVSVDLTPPTDDLLDAVDEPTRSRLLLAAAAAP